MIFPAWGSCQVNNLILGLVIPLAPGEAFGCALSPWGAQSGFQDGGGHLGEADTGGTLAAPSAGDGRKHVRGILHHSALLLRCEQKYAKAFFFQRQGSEDF